ncbi:MAG TPA: hypothetical protein DDY78_03245 [Planctomycetales bacterium]|jgi:hypothetical protein|nr:hypothetical protein [Planctomycetales bacterium]
MEEIHSRTKKEGNTAKTGGSPHVGSRVRFRMGLTDLEGVIVEDRGFIGVGGRRLWGIEVNQPDYYTQLELPEVLFQVVD